jgi:hypothetical protein
MSGQSAQLKQMKKLTTQLTSSAVAQSMHLLIFKAELDKAKKALETATKGLNPLEEILKHTSSKLLLLEGNFLPPSSSKGSSSQHTKKKTQVQILTLLYLQKNLF